MLKTAELVPALEPFTFHWKEGVVPPLLMVAEKEAAAPVHIGFEPEANDMFTTGVTFAFTVM